MKTYLLTSSKGAHHRWISLYGWVNAREINSKCLRSKNESCKVCVHVSVCVGGGNRYMAEYLVESIRNVRVQSRWVLGVGELPPPPLEIS